MGGSGVTMSPSKATMRFVVRSSGLVADLIMLVRYQQREIVRQMGFMQGRKMAMNEGEVGRPGARRKTADEAANSNHELVCP